jgi:hypothetical protein
MPDELNPEAYIAKVKEIFAKSNERERIDLISELMRIRSSIAGSTIMDLLRQYAISGNFPPNPLLSLPTYSEYANIFFPDMLNYVSISGFAFPIFWLCYIYLREDWLAPAKLESHFNIIISAYRNRKKRWPLEVDLPKVQLSDDYYKLYNEIYHLLGIFGYFAKPEVETELYEALDWYSNTVLKYSAVDSLLRLGKTIDDKYLLELIADDGMRYSMYERLKERGSLQLFPEEYRTPEAFARSGFVNMLDAAFAAEAEKIELGKVVQIKLKGSPEVSNYYVFRVLTDLGEWPEKEWVAGWVGPFPQQFDFLNLPEANHTWTLGETWGDKTPEEYVIDYLKDYQKVEID